MFTKSIRTVLAAGVLALGTAATTTAPAQADGRIGVYIGSGGSGIYFNSGGRRHHGHRYRGHRRFSCGPRRAVNKAYRWGMNNPRVKRVNKRRIVVTGWNRGHRARMVFSRHGRGCPVIKARGI